MSKQVLSALKHIKCDFVTPFWLCHRFGLDLPTFFRIVSSLETSNLLGCLLSFCLICNFLSIAKGEILKREATLGISKFGAALSLGAVG